MLNCQRIYGSTDARMLAPNTAHTQFGIELEYEGLRNDPRLESLLARPSVWRHTNEPCLRDNGGELIFNRPQSIEAAKTALAQVFAELTTPYVNHLTGMHIHIDFRHRPRADATRFVALYALFESALFALTNKSRHENIYCPSISSATSLVGSLCNFYSTGTIGDWCKYSPINLLPLQTHGSIELRIWESPTNLADAEVALDATNALYAAAISNTPLDQIASLPPRERLAAVFPQNVVQRILDTGYYEQYELNNRINYTCVVNVISTVRPASATVTSHEASELLQQLLAVAGEL